jgi:hypothetical protein
MKSTHGTRFGLYSSTPTAIVVFLWWRKSGEQYILLVSGANITPFVLRSFEISFQSV